MSTISDIPRRGKAWVAETALPNLKASTPVAPSAGQGRTVCIERTDAGNLVFHTPPSGQLHLKGQRVKTY
jgi:hypothetical protein